MRTRGRDSAKVQLGLPKAAGNIPVSGLPLSGRFVLGGRRRDGVATGSVDRADGVRHIIATRDEAKPHCADASLPEAARSARSADPTLRQRMRCHRIPT